MTAIVAFDPEFTERSMSAFVGISPEAAGLQSTPKRSVSIDCIGSDAVQKSTALLEIAERRTRCALLRSTASKVPAGANCDKGHLG